MLAPESWAEILERRAARAGIRADSYALPGVHQVRLGQLNFRYLDWGGEGLPPAVFLHGGALNAHAWDLVCLALRGRYRCFALDQRGHGDSDWSASLEYNIAALSGDVCAFFEHLDVGPVRLVGHSMGGMVSLGVAERALERLTHLVIVDVGPEPRAEGADEVREITEVGREFDSLDEAIERLQQVNPGRNAESLRQSLLFAMRQFPDGKWRWKYDPRRMPLMRTEPYASDRRRLWQALPTITCPTLIVHGGQSRIFHREDAERMAAALPDAYVVTVPEAGHNVHSQAPARLAELLLEHFER